MGVMNLGEYMAQESKIIGNKSFVFVRKPAASGNNVGTLQFNSDTENFVNVEINVDLDLCSVEQNCNSETGLRGEIDLRKTFIYED